MAKVECLLSEQLTDQRSDQKTYTLRVENQGSESVQIHAITPRIPDDVELVEIQDTSLAGAKARHTDLCSELSNLVTYKILDDSKANRRRATDAYKEIFSKALKGAGFNNIIGGRTGSALSERFGNAANVWGFKIESVADARSARSRFLSDYGDEGGEGEKRGEGGEGKQGDANSGESSVKEGVVEDSSLQDDLSSLIELFDAKVEQLERQEQNLGGEAESGELTVVAPDSHFAMGYSLNFPRNSLNPRKYVVSVDVTYSSTGAQKVLGTASTSVVISPRPLALSAVAVGSGLLGVVLNATFFTDGGTGTEPAVTQASIETIWNALASGHGLSAAILALIVFNIYEYLDFGKAVTMGVGWRSALTVGALCGLFGERMVSAVSVIVGVG